MSILHFSLLHIMPLKMGKNCFAYIITKIHHTDEIKGYLERISDHEHFDCFDDGLTTHWTIF